MPRTLILFISSRGTQRYGVGGGYRKIEKYDGALFAGRMTGFRFCFRYHGRVPPLPPALGPANGRGNQCSTELPSSEIGIIELVRLFAFYSIVGTVVERKASLCQQISCPSQARNRLKCEQ